MGIHLRKQLALWSLALLVSSCATLSSPEKVTERTFFFTQARELELSPCGCSTNPKGGVERQKNYFSNNKKVGDWYFAMGPAFSPDPQLYYPNLKKKYFEKAGALAAAFKELKLQYLGLTANELIWPVSELKKWEAEAGFTWLSANLKEKKTRAPLFKSSAWLDEKEKILITSVSDKAPKNLKSANRNIEVRPVKQAIAAVIEESHPKPALLIVLTNVPQSQLGSLENNFSVPVLFFGPTPDLELRWQQKARSTFWAGAAPRAQAVLKGSLRTRESSSGIYFDKEQSRLQRMITQNAGNKSEVENIRKLILEPNESQVELTDLSSTILNSSWEPEKK